MPIAGRGWSVRTGDTATIVTLTGDWIAREGTGAEPDAARRILDETNSGTIGFDTRQLGQWDSALLVFVAAVRRAGQARGITVDETGLPGPVRGLLALTIGTGTELRSIPAPVGLATRVGRSVLSLADEAVAVMTISGDTILRTGALSRGRAAMRGSDLLTCAYEAGVSALPVVTVINLLVGSILAFVGAVQLRRLGGEIYIAALVGIGMVREMAALMTAIAMSGRTGGAYAAHIATMQGSEEIDALRAIGIPVYDYLVLPRVIALTFMMPLLYLYGCAVGVFGGFLVTIIMLNVSAAGYMQQTRDAIAGSQLAFGLTKSVAFGILIAIAGCRTGLRAGRSAADVGHAATTAVVIGIVGVIALDAVFALCANALDF
jgi:phospholipid/cholesterol/gamma-HCH transport system permease protein